jgi:molecular chaperone DnaK
VPQIDVTFNIDTNAILNIKSQDQDTGVWKDITIKSLIKLSDDEISSKKLSLRN